MSFERPLLIAGCPRSGTSLTALAFQACGIWAGAVTSLGENSRIKNEVLKPALRAGGMDDIAVRSFADVTANPAAIRKGVRGVLEREGWDGGPWLFKDVKLVFCWRSWADAFPLAQWVTVWRDPEAILESFGRWGLARGLAAYFDGRRIIREHHERAAQIPATKLYPDRLLNGPACYYDRDYAHVAELMGVDWAWAAVADVVDPHRYHATPR